MPSIRDTRGATGTQGMLRGARTTAELPGQETRASMGRGEHLSRGSYINYYDDLKLSTTPDNANLIRKQEGDFQTAVAERQGKITDASTKLEGTYSQAKKQIALAQSQIPDFKSTVNKAWNEYTSGGSAAKGFVSSGKDADVKMTPSSTNISSYEDLINNPNVSYSELVTGMKAEYRPDFVDVSVTHNGKVEGTYKVPREVAHNVAGNNSLKTQWTNKEMTGLHVDVDSSGKKGPQIGEELHVALGTAAERAYNEFYDKFAPPLAKQINEGKKAISASSKMLESDYATQSATIGVAKEEVASKIQQREDEWEVLRTNYDKKKATIADIFSKMNVKEAGNNAENV